MTPTPNVIALGYLGLDVSNLPAWREFMSSIFGLHPVDEDSNEDMLSYRIDERRQRLRLYKSDVDWVRNVGWEVGSSDDLDAIEKHLKSKGAGVARASAEQSAARAVRKMLIVDAPDGVNAEIFCDAMSTPMPPVSTKNRSGFKTGSLGMGHVVFVASDEEATAQWYETMLGFRVSDRVYWGGANAVFLRCNPRHHSAAFHTEVSGMKPGQINHFMFEANDMEDVGRAYDAVKERAYPLGLTIGKHSNDLMTSFYVETPSGWWMEYGWGGLNIDDDDWEVKLFDSPKIWGHLGSNDGHPE